MKIEKEETNTMEIVETKKFELPTKSKVISIVGKKSRKRRPNNSRKGVKITQTQITKTTKTTKTVKTTVTTQRVLTAENKIKLRKRQFKAWKDDQFVIDTLVKRGWIYQGEPIPDGREDYPQSMYDAREEGRIPDEPCLYWADDDDSKVLKGLSHQHMISSIPNVDKALTKVYQQKLFNNYSWFPKCFTLPKQRDLLLEYTKIHPDTFWIAKPRDSYGGFGMCVFKAGSEEFHKMIGRKTTFAVQRYMENPYLFAGQFKFHIRGYMIVTNARDPLRAYLWKNAQIQFSTHPFDLTQIENNFNKYSHITNYKVNNEKKNKAFVLADKPGIGAGTEWGMKKFVDYMTENEPKFCAERFWIDLTEIARVVAQKMMQNAKVEKAFKNLTAYATNHFEIYGLDIIMDEHCNLAITEANTTPGLDHSDPVMANGVFNPEIVVANDITAGIINDSVTLLGLDKRRKFYSPFIRLHQ